MNRPQQPRSIPPPLTLQFNRHLNSQETSFKLRSPSTTQSYEDATKLHHEASLHHRHCSTSSPSTADNLARASVLQFISINKAHQSSMTSLSLSPSLPLPPWPIHLGTQTSQTTAPVPSAIL
ncbi:hypothetical protein M0R45_024109 [Rubus argutus]|uniref:Uncharacterized protein n=1 Tax=Rubus argutus TaxID=59490 RepID=A0AAW1WS84_RUBAR